MWLTTEPANLVDNSYPGVVKKFIEKTEKPKKVPKKRKVPKENVDPKQAKLNFAVGQMNIKKKKKDPVDALKETNDVCSLVDSFSGTFVFVFLMDKCFNSNFFQNWILMMKTKIKKVIPWPTLTTMIMNMMVSPAPWIIFHFMKNMYRILKRII